MSPAVPGPSVFPSGEPGVSGDFWGSQDSGPSSSCVWNPRVVADEARGWQCPFVLCLHPQGCLRSLLMPQSEQAGRTRWREGKLDALRIANL